MTDEYLQATIKVLFHHHKFNLGDGHLLPPPSLDAGASPALHPSLYLSSGGCVCVRLICEHKLQSDLFSGESTSLLFPIVSVLTFVMSQLEDVTEERIRNRTLCYYIKVLYPQRDGGHSCVIMSLTFISLLFCHLYLFFLSGLFPPMSNISPLLFASSPPLSSPGSGGSRENQRGSAPRGAKDVAFPSEHLQPPGVHPGCSPVPVEYQTLYHMSGNHGNNRRDIESKHRSETEALICKILFFAAKS